jgi:hypothetical protein
MKVDCDLQSKPIGEMLEEAGLINKAQLEVALNEQNIYQDLKLGEILVLHGWLREETADFFGQQIKSLAISPEKKQIGKYFCEAGLLSQEDLQAILDEQQTLGVKFGSVAVLRGCIKQKTLDFFLKYFSSENARKSHFSYKDQNILDAKKRFLNKTKKNNQKKASQNSYTNRMANCAVNVVNDNQAEKLTLSDLDFEISWIG